MMSLFIAYLDTKSPLHYIQAQYETSRKIGLLGKGGFLTDPLAFKVVGVSLSFFTWLQFPYDPYV